LAQTGQVLILFFHAANLCVKEFSINNSVDHPSDNVLQDGGCQGFKFVCFLVAAVLLLATPCSGYPSF
jgi:hypothetical protein